MARDWTDRLVLIWADLSFSLVGSRWVSRNTLALPVLVFEQAVLRQLEEFSIVELHCVDEYWNAGDGVALTLDEHAYSGSVGQCLPGKFGLQFPVYVTR